MSANNPSPVDCFLEQYWADHERSSIRPLAEYLHLFPGDEIGVAAEFVRLQRGPAEPSDGHSRLGPYRLIRELGRGGQGVVYLAEDTVLQRPVAIKVLPDLDPTERVVAEKFFRHEILAQARCMHRNICAVRHAGASGNELHIVMEYVAGPTLAVILQRVKAIPPEATVALLVQASDGLQAAHAAGVIHRDLKPSNLILNLEDDGFRARILDFGLAIVDRRDAQQVLTGVGCLAGTSGYMSPEQLRGEVVDHRTDIFTLGVIAYEMLVGKRPAISPVAVTTSKGAKLRLPARVHGRRIPPWLSNLVIRSLEVQPRRRPRDMATFRAALGPSAARGWFRRRAPEPWDVAFGRRWWREVLKRGAEDRDQSPEP